MYCILIASCQYNDIFYLFVGLGNGWQKKKIQSLHIAFWKWGHSSNEIEGPKFPLVKKKYDLTLCQSRLHTASETFFRNNTIRMGLNFPRFTDPFEWCFYNSEPRNDGYEKTVCKELNLNINMYKMGSKYMFIK